MPGIHIIGLFGNIRNLLHDLSGIHPIKIQFLNEGIQENELDEKLQLTIFRIIQEQINNILNHSKASSAIINLTRKDDLLTLRISDNGEGCDPVKEKNGVGIINIKSRAEIYHGNVSILSKPGEGYELKVDFSLNEFV